MAHRTPLYDEHRALGARLVEFGGWDMPLSYTSALEEHRAVRTRCGLFDVSHMGEVELRGPGAMAAMARLATNDVHRLADGQAQYSLLCNEQGGIVDDLIVYRLGPAQLFVVVNAATTVADVAWMRAHLTGEASLDDQSDAWALLALQGPRAARALGPLVGRPLDTLASFTIRDDVLAGCPVRVARTGYTGEDGFELFVPADQVVPAWRALLARVRDEGGLPAGLAARDTLRLEAGLLLYGTDMDATTTPWEAGLGWVVKGTEYIGRAALEAARQGPRRRLVGLVMDEPGVPRHGAPVLRAGQRVGAVTSGTKSPTLDSFIGLAYVSGEPTTPGTPLTVEMRGKPLRAHVVARPFYRRQTKEGA
ncbi:MAG TPA: glycine cleavage system aminomethyltransferase GcvT [Candidatus Limnocylindria bacterium]|nr:glycine cleavage system aminomethyltransferase GcvT [Candidatus Limnocylindria bacterium]